ncbi:hypothetical protein LMIV_1701 [Listeria monocytogenes FSL J1-208]|nr:hypothetical protein LMIV_1701 [Listeria monocytogenes FSL J1-208]
MYCYEIRQKVAGFPFFIKKDLFNSEKIVIILFSNLYKIKRDSMPEVLN